MSVAAQYAPLEAPLVAASLGAAEMVAGFDSCWTMDAQMEGQADKEAARVKQRFEEHRDRLLALDAKQGLLDRLAKLKEVTTHGGSVFKSAKGDRVSDVSAHRMVGGHRSVVEMRVRAILVAWTINGFRVNLGIVLLAF